MPALRVASLIAFFAWLYENAPSRDKDFFVLDGATHNIDPCVECETRKGEYSNIVRNFFNRDWMNQRFSR